MTENLPELKAELQPEDNKFHKGNGSDGKHYWLTPPELYGQLTERFKFDFDPCPFPKPDDFDGLTCEWGHSSYVNPPFGSIMHDGKKKGATAWARKAIAEHQKGKKVVLVHPIDKWVLMLLAAGAKVENLGDVKWLATEDGSAGKGTGRHIAAFILGHEPAEAQEPPKCATCNKAMPEECADCTLCATPEPQGDVAEAIATVNMFIGYCHETQQKALRTLIQATRPTRQQDGRVERYADPSDADTPGDACYQRGWNDCLDKISSFKGE